MSRSRFARVGRTAQLATSRCAKSPLRPLPSAATPGCVNVGCTSSCRRDGAGKCWGAHARRAAPSTARTPRTGTQAITGQHRRPAFWQYLPSAFRGCAYWAPGARCSGALPASAAAAAAPYLAVETHVTCSQRRLSYCFDAFDICLVMLCSGLQSSDLQNSCTTARVAIRSSPPARPWAAAAASRGTDARWR